MGCSPSCLDKNSRSSHASMSSSAQLAQFAKEVVHFSSQYGGDQSMAYVVPNLAGPCTIFPSYGDFTNACVFRTYGTWWEMAPSAEVSFGRSEGFSGTDFVDLFFEEKVYPTAINIYEIYHPGAIIEICAAEIERKSTEGQPVQPNNIRWHKLWSGNPQQSNQAEIFSPPIEKVNTRTNLIRLVFNQRFQEYYTELDGVKLVGMKVVKDEGTDIDQVYIEHLKKLSLSDEKDIDSIVPPLKAQPTTDNGFFDMLPGELIQLIFTYLSLIDKCHIATTCMLFRRHCYDQLLYMELNLQPYWHLISNNTLSGLRGRCSQLQKLDLSWCGDWGKIEAQEFHRFIKACGSELRVLRMKACRFVTKDVLEDIAHSCPRLEELSIPSCRCIDSHGYTTLQYLTKLQVLNLYRSKVTESEMIQIVRKLPQLRHLNLGATKTIANFDSVISAVGKHCPLLESLDVWRAATLSCDGVESLAKGCPNLLELDVGWCPELRGNNVWVSNLCTHSTKLKKLFLTSIRSIADVDLFAIASGLHNLEQLDILGAQRVGIQGLIRVLDKCPMMKFIDVSFCRQITQEVVLQLREKYPNVAIKRSFTI
ncbi:F-box/LRR-repeat protein 4-like [Diadema antillarum]|uniref:F-box/LRR-repeat protein 4-like n=1 Tax=Diadema antillarum TaxID=105358 RepID=UPI003A86816F